MAEKFAIDECYFENLAKGQSPEFLYIGCSDSRVTAEQLMGVGPGEVFVHRNIANLVPNTDLSVMSVINYAVNHLMINHILKAGHPSNGLNYLIALENENIDERISNFESNVCKLEKVACFEPGIYDSFIHWLNPVNRNETCSIYKLMLP